MTLEACYDRGDTCGTSGSNDHVAGEASQLRSYSLTSFVILVVFGTARETMEAPIGFCVCGILPQS